jgi:hypothetical protein
MSVVIETNGQKLKLKLIMRQIAFTEKVLT